MIEKITIEIYDDDFRWQVVDKADALTGMKIMADDTYLQGGSDPDFSAGDYMCSNLITQLESIESIRANQKQIIEYSNGPTYLVCEPRDEDTFFLTACITIEGARNPAERLPVDTTAIVKKRAWIEELIRATEEHIDRILKLNPSVADDAQLVYLQNELATVIDTIQ